MKNLSLIVVFLLYLGLVYPAQAQDELTPAVSSSSDYSSYYSASKTIDNNTSTTYWIGIRDALPWWLMYDLQREYSLEKITIWWFRNYGSSNYDIQVSNNGSNWDTVLSGLSTAGAVSHPFQATHSLNGTSARYVRIYIHTEERYYPVIFEVKIYGAAGNQPPQASASANPVQGKAPLEVRFTGSGTDSDGTITGYSWNFGDGGTSSQQNPVHTYNTPGSYTAKLTLTDNIGATGQDSVLITVSPPNKPPNANASANPVTGKAPLEVHFTASGTDSDGTIIGYSWNFGDGGTSSQQNPVYTYNTAGSYTAKLTVTDNDNATGSFVLVITVEAPSLSEIPRLIRFQAKLGDSEGQALEGVFRLSFRLYDTDIAGVPIWQEQQPAVIVEAGILDVELGSVNPLDLPFDRQYWLGVEVESDGEMVPRFKLTTVPYSFRSSH